MIFENQQVKGLFNSDLDKLFKSRLDELFDYKRVGPICNKLITLSSVKSYKNKKLDNTFKVNRIYKNDNSLFAYSIRRNYRHLKNFVFYRIGRQNFPPKRVIIKDLDD